MTGARGKPGKPGDPGKPGTPGLSAWTIRGEEVSKLLIPPSIAGVKRGDREIPPHLVLKEGQNLRLECTVSGAPTPAVSWTRKDGSPIPVGSWQGKLSSANRSPC